MPSTDLKASAPRTIAFTVLNSPAHPCRYRRFACPLTGANARLAEKRGSVTPSFRGTCTPYLLPVRLAHQILASHPDAAGAGELEDIHLIGEGLEERLPGAGPYPDCVPSLDGELGRRLAAGYLERLAVVSADAARVTDKLPANFKHLGLIALLFPRSRVVHCRREPMDTCFSIYFRRFRAGHGYAFELGKLAHYYRHYVLLMEHWRRACPLPMLELGYEDLVGDVETWGRRLVAFCGLPWDERCLGFHRSERLVRTASLWQVRQPIYGTAVGRWKNYEAQLAPLKAALGPIEP